MNQNLLVILFILALLIGLLIMIAHFSKPRLDKKYFQTHWQKIEAEQNHTLALISADRLLDQALKSAHLKGETMGERLNRSAGIIKDVNSVWQAHKLRNKLVHEPDAKLSYSELRRALRQFKTALKDLGAL